MMPIPPATAHLSAYAVNLTHLRRDALRNGRIFLRAHRHLLALVGLYLAVAFLPGAFGYQTPPFSVVMPIFSTIAAIYALLLPTAVVSPGMALRITHVLMTVALFIVIEFAALGIKANLAAISPWSWDETLAQADRLLFLGTDPWRLLQPLAGHPGVTLVLDAAYKLWMAILIVSWFAVALNPRHDKLRIRYFLAFLLTWVLGGNLLAYALSSAGPAFLEHMGAVATAAAYADLMAYLKSIHSKIDLTAIHLQTLLWQQHVAGHNELGGISAFPSMHNALATLMALAAWRMHRGLGILLVVFTLMIFAGSILLAWHYAVDGIAGMAVALLCWHLAGRIARGLERLPEIRRYRALLRATRNR